MPQALISDMSTEGIRVRAVARYMPDQSTPEDHRFLFSYRITIINEGTRRVQLLARHWIIINSDGDREDVRGPGVVGQKPTLGPGEKFTYTSYCPLDTEWGTMEGSYQMLRDNGEIFDAIIGRFYLSTTATEMAGSA